jgi:hypothetical protein
MNDATWPTDRTACFGTCCHLHSTCQRYAAVDNSTEGTVFIDHCGMEYRMYIPILPSTKEASCTS